MFELYAAAFVIILVMPLIAVMLVVIAYGVVGLSVIIWLPFMWRVERKGTGRPAGYITLHGPGNRYGVQPIHGLSAEERADRTVRALCTAPVQSANGAACILWRVTDTETTDPGTGGPVVSGIHGSREDALANVTQLARRGAAARLLTRAGYTVALLNGSGPARQHEDAGRPADALTHVARLPDGDSENGPPARQWAIPRHR